MSGFDGHCPANVWNVKQLRIAKHHDFVHHHCVSALACSNTSISMAPTILRFLSPRAPEVPAPVCTLPDSVSASTTPTRVYQENPLDSVSETFHVDVGSQRIVHSNQRTRNQFRPRNATKGTTSYQLRQYAEATLGGGSLRKIVKLPDGEDENEWLAVNSTLNIAVVWASAN